MLIAVGNEQELQMLSTVTRDCQVKKIVLNSGSQLSQVCRIVFCNTRQSCRLVTIETLITILTIENLNSCQSLIPDNQE